MASPIAEILIKAVAGGLLVLAFAALAETISPKPFAGVFSAAPSVALGGLLVTFGYTGAASLIRPSEGMQVGAVAFAVYCLAAVPLVKALGAWWGSATALGVWAVVVAAGYLLVLR
jgi:hypothetical protein